MNVVSHTGFQAKLIFLTGMFFAGTITVTHAQDTMYLRDGTQIASKVLEIGMEEVRYKKEGFDDGPVFVIKRELLSRILFENGYEESFTPRLPDAITLCSGEEIRAEIVEVGESAVIFRQGTATDTLPKTDIAFITYINGTVEKIQGLSQPRKKKKIKR
ncbi:MAG: hypothetical protein R3C61_10005 [Bacteroidia bacterium]